ncbi:putative N-acetyltransferase YycN [Pullulanibacillus camelliae]|uniref:Putative N-acetyltransferase YycN n=1 Tax=Pullulanibacillus camelliae TaxID=1707096 RepID=A0A8J3DXY2_9BACL|nr:GNAT family N-acetyltransferase [Pullulanibacillus camelliae]GGE48811.1 putative N-acetyltransferase YycN [Pullulanibacillus camelliae]
MVTLQPMNDSAFQAYIATALPEYANEHVKSGDWAKEEAMEKADMQFKQLLPEGIRTKGHYLFSLVHNDQKIGMLWVKLTETAHDQSAFIYDIKVDEAYQGQGLGKATMTALDSFARSKGIKTIKLHVFAHNTRALSLYKKMNYQITDYYMMKKV